MSQQGNLNTWFQEGQPSSYKIQIMYVDIPKHMILDKKSVDTPFRFRNFEEATQTASELFKGYETRIVGSKDQPHWQVPPNTRMTNDDLNDTNWYDIYGVTPAYRTQRPPIPPKLKQEAEGQAEYKELKKLKPMQ